MKFFEGSTTSWGVIERRGGSPTSQFCADLVGTREGETLAIAQRFVFADGRTQTRNWRIRRLDAGTLEASANDVETSLGRVEGNVFRWSYTTEGSRAWFVDDLDYDLWMYLMDDGETVINRVSISKFGLLLARTTERFVKVRDRTSACDSSATTQAADAEER